MDIKLMREQNEAAAGKCCICQVKEGGEGMALLDRLLHRQHPENNRNKENRETGRKVIMESTADDENSDTDRKKLVSGLANREYDLYLLLLEGFTPKECAKMLKIRDSEAKACMLEIFRRLKVSTRAELIINYRGINKA